MSSSNDHKEDLSTRCVHAGEMDDPNGSPHTPIYNTTLFKFKSMSEILDVVEGRKSGSLYTRYGLNPSVISLEKKLASLEEAEESLVFSSGMAAESALFLSHGRNGIVCIGDVYGGTLDLLTSQLPQLGIRIWTLLGREIGQLDGILQNGAGLIFFETPTNPALEILDIEKISTMARRHGALVAVDNTFASPVNQQPLKLGADLAVHSATKYLGGHSDITAGAIMGTKKLLDAIRPWRKNLGQMLAPETASLLARSLRTLVLRVERQNETAMAIAKAMRKNERVLRVLYPGLSDFPGHELAKKQMSGFGGMVTLELKGDLQTTSSVIDQLKLFSLGPSLGGPESLVNQPVNLTHHGLGRDELKRRGISDSMIRISVGLESPSDLINDLNQALQSVPDNVIPHFK